MNNRSRLKTSVGELSWSNILTRTDILMLGWLAINLLVFLHVAWVPQSPLVTYVYTTFLYILGSGISYYSNVVRRIFIIGTIAGVIELFGDYFLVKVASVLVYPSGFPMLLESPLYMPLAWTIVITQLGYLSLRLYQVYGRTAAVVGSSATAMMLVGFYESFSYNAGIWMYVSAPELMLGHAPLFIVLAEGIMFSMIHYFRQQRPVLGGVAFGLVINASYVAMYYLVTLF